MTTAILFFTDMQKAQVMLFQPRRARRKQGGCKFIICCLRDLRGEITSGRMQLELSRPVVGWVEIV